MKAFGRRISAQSAGRAIARSAVCFCALFLVPAVVVSGQVPPDARWLAFETPNFRVTYMEGLEEIARRAGDRAEVAHGTLVSELVSAPRGKIELVVADNVDFSNGYATPFPTNRIVIFANPPVGEASLAFYDDWLQLLITHELVHVFHLDFARGVWRPLRAVFGRNPLLFPQIFAPGWVTEGLATYFESRLTEGGRVKGPLHEMALRTAILEDAFFTIDRATGDPAVWPAGAGRYIYGSMFVDHLARKYGPESVPRFVEEMGRRLIPYRPDAAARRIFGTSFSREWRVWEDSLRARYAAVADSLTATGVTEPEVLVEEGRYAAHPRFSPDGTAIAFSRGTGREEAGLRLISLDGTENTVAPLTSLGPPSWAPDGSVVIAQLEHVDPYRTYSDVYRIGPDGGRERLTFGARLQEVSVHPDGDTVVGVQSHGGTNVLVVRSLQSGEERLLTPPSLDVHWAAPRWDPAGERIAVSRWRSGGLYDVVVMDGSGEMIRQITQDRAVDSAPAWSGDGRYLLFSSDRTGIPNLFAFDLQEERLLQVTNVVTGAFQPDVSPDGRWIVFSYYRPDGYSIARIPFDPGSWRPAPPLRRGLEPLDAPNILSEPSAGGQAERYSPWPSVRPAAWSLMGDEGSGLGLGAGIMTWGEDVVQRHRWVADVLYYPRGSRAEANASYRYAGLGNPVLNLEAGQDWLVRAAQGQLVDSGGVVIPSAQLRRDRFASASAAWVHRRVRSTGWVGAGGDVTEVDLVWEDPPAAGGRILRQFPLELGTRAEVGYSTVRAFTFSIGPRQGVSTVARAEARRYTRALDGEGTGPGYVRLTSRNRGFRGFDLPGYAHHVLAVRLDAGAERGSISPGFRIGGASGAASSIPIPGQWLGGRLGFPVRGFAEGVQRGDRAFSGTAEYRFPILLVERGFRLLPVFLHRTWGDLFIDTGAAWCPGRCELGFASSSASPEPLVSVGGELVLDLELAYGSPLPLRAGIAKPLNGPAPARPQLYLRLGRSF